MRRHLPIRAVDLAALTGGLLLLGPAPAWAYIDPGSGSMAYQVLLAGILAAGFLFRRSWARVRTWLRLRGESQAPVDDGRDPR